VTRRWPRLRCAALALLLSPACGDDPSASEPAPEDETGTFIALQRDFQGFQGWDSFTLSPESSIEGFPIAPRTVYVNQPLPDGADEAPQGTIIVKVSEGGLLPEDWDYHAMVKRGGSFNAQGARGWEWFELDVEGDEVAIVWRGLKPPDGHRYGVTPGREVSDDFGDCNACHRAASDNDFLFSVSTR
jgi:hypothetical protein